MSALSSFIRGHGRELVAQLSQHLVLTVAALALAAALGLPLGLWLTRNRRLATAVLGGAGVIQTIPSLALLGFLIPFTGIGAAPAILALFLYALLPIVRNTIVGVESTPSAVKEAAAGMGMTDLQVLGRVELPLAAPVIFAGIRTATVVAVGVATLAALVGGGGLGVYIFRGISLANTTMILAGAIPAAGLSLLLDAILGRIERRPGAPLVPVLLLAALLSLAFVGRRTAFGPSEGRFRIGVQPEFVERPDGYAGLSARYGLRARPVELDHGLVYLALVEHRVDAVIGYSTDGEIAAFGLRVLADDRHYFPPYFAAPLVRSATLRAHPELRRALSQLSFRLDEKTMARLNARVEHEAEAVARVAEEFLRAAGLPPGPHRRGPSADVVVGSKPFAEQYLLAEMFADLIETYTGLSVRLETGLGGTKICFEALAKGAIDVYPEYTGTGLYAILGAALDHDGTAPARDAQAVYDHVKREFARRFDMEWLPPLGFANTYAVIVRNDGGELSRVRTASELSAALAE